MLLSKDDCRAVAAVDWPARNTISSLNMFKDLSR